jgi:hypothetical protein
MLARSEAETLGEYTHTSVADVEPALRLRACDQMFSVTCPDRTLASHVSRTFADLAVRTQHGEGVADAYRISRAASHGGVVVETTMGRTVLNDTSGLLFHLDKHLIVRLQHQRPDLYFLHGAAIAMNGRVAVVVAPSGNGKSTLAFTLLRRGVTYLSDELVPIDVSEDIVHPYPRAICLKSPPPMPYQLPAETLRCGSVCYVPTNTPGSIDGVPMALGALFFLDRGSRANPCEPLTAASAVAHLVANSLNPLAHPGWGVDAACTLAERVPCFALNSTHLERACSAVIAVMNGVA